MAWRRIPFLAPHSQTNNKEDYWDRVQKMKANRNVLILLQSRRKSIKNREHCQQITEKQELIPFWSSPPGGCGSGPDQVTSVTQAIAVSIWFLMGNCYIQGGDFSPFRMEPGLQSLLLCTDDAVVRVLRRVLSELEIGVEHCLDADSAVQKLTRQRFEAVIVDCSSRELASKILKGARSSPVNNRA